MGEFFLLQRAAQRGEETGWRQIHMHSMISLILPARDLVIPEPSAVISMPQSGADMLFSYNIEGFIRWQAFLPLPINFKPNLANNIKVQRQVFTA